MLRCRFSCQLKNRPPVNSSPNRLGTYRLYMLLEWRIASPRLQSVIFLQLWNDPLPSCNRADATAGATNSAMCGCPPTTAPPMNRCENNSGRPIKWLAEAWDCQDADTVGSSQILPGYLGPIALDGIGPNGHLSLTFAVYLHGLRLGDARCLACRREDRV